VGQLVGVHGIGKQYLGRHQLLDSWSPALADGLERASGRRARRPDLDLAFYGDVFLAKVESTKPTKGAVEDAPDLADLDGEELIELTEAVHEVVAPEDLAAAELQAAKAHTRLPKPVQTLLGAVERRFGPASGVLYLGELRQVLRYLRDPQLKTEVDDLVATATAGSSILIGHSLGSIVAYEYLRQHPDHSIQLLVTLGSPLGLRMVRKRLTIGALDIPQWTNVRDPRDPVACAGDLRRWCPQVDDQPVDNGSDAHTAERYLSRRATGEAVLKVLPELAS
jgi:hypothetical protein